MHALFLVMTIVCGISSLLMFIGIISTVCDDWFDNRFTNGLNDLMSVVCDFALFASISTASIAGITALVNHIFF